MLLSRFLKYFHSRVAFRFDSPDNLGMTRRTQPTLRLFFILPSLELVFVILNDAFHFHAIELQ